MQYESTVSCVGVRWPRPVIVVTLWTDHNWPTSRMASLLPLARVSASLSLHLIQTHFGGCISGNACDEGARKQSWQQRCDPNTDSSWIGDGPFPVKRIQCFSDN